MRKRNGGWTKLEMLRVLAIYASIGPAERTKTPDHVIDLAQKVLPLRSSASIKMRIANYIARDPEMSALGLSGMYGGGDHVGLYWEQNSDDHGNLDLKKLLFNLATAQEEVQQAE